jgi:hypothetical protein
MFDRSVCCNGKTVLLILEAACVLHKFIYSREVLQLTRFLIKEISPCRRFSWVRKNFTVSNCAKLSV